MATPLMQCRLRPFCGIAPELQREKADGEQKAEPRHTQNWPCDLTEVRCLTCILPYYDAHNPL